MKQRIRCFLCLSTCVFSFLLSVPASGEEANGKTLSPYFVVVGEGSSVEQFPLKETNVSVNIEGVIADVHVIQKYTNEGTQPINASYVFPASAQASVHGMTMVIGERRVTAEIKEREAAKTEFVEAKKQGKSASLLEQQRPNVFTMNVANIMPKDDVQIDMHYSELLVPTDGTYEFVYPTVVGPRYSNQPEEGAAETDKWVKSPYLSEGNVPPTSFNITASVSTGIPLQDLMCPSHKVDVKWNTFSNAEMTLVPSGEFAGNRDFILKYRLTGKQIQSGLMLQRGEKENFFLLMVQPPERMNPTDIPPREYIFVLDVSGSMFGFPLDTAKVLIRDLIGHLRQTDKFNVVLFAGASVTMAPSSVFATTENIDRSIKFIEDQKGKGGTELAAALKKAFSLPEEEAVSRTVVVITDGLIAAEKEIFELIQNNLGRSNVFSFGIGHSVNRYLVEGVAKAGLGESFVVTRPQEAAAAAARFRAYVQSPLLTNVEVRFKDFDTYDVEPPKVPDLFANRPLVVFGKWRGEPKGEIEISGLCSGGGYFNAFDLSKVGNVESDGALRYLWARFRLARLSDFAAGTSHPELKEEITSLGIAYSLLTQYTSFVAVLDKVRNTGAEAKDVDQPLPLPKGVSNFAVGGGMLRTPEPELTLLLFLIPPILAGCLIFGRRSRAALFGNK